MLAIMTGKVYPLSKASKTKYQTVQPLIDPLPMVFQVGLSDNHPGKALCFENRPAGVPSHQPFDADSKKASGLQPAQLTDGGRSHDKFRMTLRIRRLTPHFGTAKLPPDQSRTGWVC